jgi:Ni,Fe-hydrogenase III large subunit
MSLEGRELARTVNGGSLKLEEIPRFQAEALTDIIAESLAAGMRISAYFAAAPWKSSARASAELYVVLADDEQSELRVGAAEVGEEGIPSIAERFPQAQLFEREIHEQFGIPIPGHPWLKPVRYERPTISGRPPVWPMQIQSGRAEALEPGTADFFRVEGEEVHEVAVGPVHAGVIEPGHFRFQCHGERVFFLEIALGYQHRGVEKALLGGPDRASIHLVETACGDSTVAHTTCYSDIIEALGRTRKTARAQAIAAIALELERLACHTGDLGAISGDVGFLPTASYCGRIRGDFLNMTALVCGNRFGRNLVLPGGLRFDLDERLVEELSRRLRISFREAKNAIDLLWDSQSVMARLEDTGKLSRNAAIELGLVGPAARACGLQRDVRFDQSSGIYRMAHIPVSTHDAGDVLARAAVRYMEIQRSVEFIEEQLASLPSGEVRGRDGVETSALEPDSFAVALSEGWRGEVCHVAITDASGAFSRYKIVDPSFHNWPALAYAMRDQEISDFPLCNKSFNLSYCGHDL